MSENDHVELDGIKQSVLLLEPADEFASRPLWSGHGEQLVDVPPPPYVPGVHLVHVVPLI